MAPKRHRLEPRSLPEIRKPHYHRGRTVRPVESPIAAGSSMMDPAEDVRAAPELIDSVQGIRVTRDVGASVRVAPCRCTSLRTRRRSHVRAYLMPHSSFAMPRTSFAAPSPTLASCVRLSRYAAGSSRYRALPLTKSPRHPANTRVSPTRTHLRNTNIACVAFISPTRLLVGRATPASCDARTAAKLRPWNLTPLVKRCRTVSPYAHVCELRHFENNFSPRSTATRTQ